MMQPIRTKHNFPTVSLSHQEASISLFFFSIRGQTEWKPQSQETHQPDHMDHSPNSMKLWAMQCRATQDGRAMGESSDKTWSTGEMNGKPLQYYCLENPISSMKRQNDRILKEELPRSLGAQYATGDQRRDNSRMNEETAPKKNNTQLWMLLVMEVKSNAVRTTAHRNLES